jgi:hypothetical protein
MGVAHGGSEGVWSESRAWWRRTSACPSVCACCGHVGQGVVCPSWARLRPPSAPPGLAHAAPGSRSCTSRLAPLSRSSGPGARAASKEQPQPRRRQGAPRPLAAPRTRSRAVTAWPGARRAGSRTAAATTSATFVPAAAAAAGHVAAAALAAPGKRDGLARGKWAMGRLAGLPCEPGAGEDLASSAHRNSIPP